MNFDPQNFGEFLDVYQHYISDRRQYQAGGDAQGGGSQQQFMQEAVQAIASGKADAHDVFMQLQQMGMEQKQAASVVEQIVKAAANMHAQSQLPKTEGEVGQMQQASYGGQLRQYQSDVATGNVNNVGSSFNLYNNAGPMADGMNQHQKGAGLLTIPPVPMKMETSTEEKSAIPDLLNKDTWTNSLTENKDKTKRDFNGVASPIDDGSTLSDPYTTTRTDHNMISNIEDTGLNRTFAGLNSLGNPKNMVHMLKNTGAQGFVKKLAGIGAIVGGAGLGYQKFASPDKVTTSSSAPEGTMLRTDKNGQQTSISPCATGNCFPNSSANAVINSMQPKGVPNLTPLTKPQEQQQRMQDFAKGNIGVSQISGMPVPFQYGYGAEVDFDHMYLPQHQSDIRTGQVAGIPYNNDGPLADGMNPGQSKTIVGFNPADFGDTPITLKPKPVVANQSEMLQGAASPFGLNPTEKDFVNTPINPTINPTTKTNTTKTRGDAAGIQVASNMLNGFDLLNSTLGVNDEQKRYDQAKRDAGNSDSLASTNAYNPFGMHTVNDQNALGRTPNMGAIQDIGGYMATAANGGDINDFGAYLTHYAQGGDMDEYAEGGEYELTEAQIRQILANGGEIEFL